MEPSVVGAPWSRARLVGFRFLFCYLVIVNAPFPFGALPWTEKVAEAVRWPLMRVELGDGRLEVYRTAAAIASPGKLDLRFPIDSDRTSRGLLDLRPDPTGFVLEGSVGRARIRAHLAPIAVAESLLMSRGFHWINEVPFNR